MKKLFIFVTLISCVLCLSSCGNRQNKNTDSTTKSEQTSLKEQYLQEDFKIKMDSLASEVACLGALPILTKSRNGEFKLTEKEQMVKPDYLLSPERANEAVTLSQKYRILVMYVIDMNVAGVYNMPVESYSNVVNKLVVDINDPILSEIKKSESKRPYGEYIDEIYKQEVVNGTANYLWEMLAAGMIETLYVMSQNIDLFMTCFTDETASELSYRMVLVLSALDELVPYCAGLEKVQAALIPLKIINAIDMKQLRQQIFDAKEIIGASRSQMLL